MIRSKTRTFLVQAWLLSLAIFPEKPKKIELLKQKYIQFSQDEAFLLSKQKNRRKNKLLKTD